MLIEIVVFEMRDGGHFLCDRYEVLDGGIRPEHTNAIMLLDAAANAYGYAEIKAVGIRSAASTGNVKYYIDEAFIHATER